MEQKILEKKTNWQAKLIPIGFCWILFIAINSTINQAPYDKSQLSVEQALLFFLPLFAAFYFSFAFLLRSKRRGILVSLLVSGLLLLRLFSLTSPINVLLLGTLLVFMEWVFTRHLPRRLPKK